MADRYWVGGTANWDGTAGTKWATTSGGAGGASVPTTADDVFFTNLSTGTCTISNGNTGAKSINCTGFTGTLAGSAGIDVAGSVTLVAGMTVTYSGLLVISGTGTLTTAGKTIGPLTVAGSGITVTLGDALTSSGAITLSTGTFTTNNFNVTATSLSSIAGIRTFNLGSSTVALSGNTPIDFSSTSGLTFNAGTSQINLSGASATINGGGVTFNNVAYTSTTAGTRAITGANTFNNLTVTAPSAAGVTQVTFDSRQTINGTLSTTGTAGNRRVWFRGVTYGLAQTLTINSAPSLTDADFRDIYVIGTAAPISGTRIGDLRGCRGITFSTPKTVYWSSAAGGTWSATNWAATSGGATSNDNFPLAQDTAVIENTGLNTSATVTLNATLPFVGTLDMSTRTNAATISISSGNVVYGNLVTGSGITYSGAQVVTFSGRNTQTITSAGKTFSGGITVDSYGGTVELADALNIGSNTLTVTNGTFDTKNYNVTAGSFSSSNSNVRAVKFGSSTITISGTSVPFNIGTTTTTNFTFDAGTSQINFTGAIAGSAMISATNATFYNVAFTNTGTASPFLSGSGNTFNDFSITPTASAGLRTFYFDGPNTINGTLTVAGATATRRVFIYSSTLGSPRTLTVNSLSANDCDFRDITIAGTAAGSSPTRAGDCGGNSGITFPAPKTVYWNLAGTSAWTDTGWAPSSGGTPDINQFPLAQDTAVFDNTGSVTGTITINAAWNIGTFDASTRTSAMTLTTSTNSPSVYGDWKFGTGVTSTSTTGTITFAKNGTQTITSNGVQFGCPVTVNHPSGTVQLADALSLNSARTLSMTIGAFDAVTYNVTVGRYLVTTGTTRMGTGTWTLSGTGSVWIAAGTIIAGTSTIVLSDTSTSARDFAGSSSGYYNKLTIGGSTGTSTLTITSGTFGELASTKTVAHTILFQQGSLTNIGKWSVTGTAGNIVTINSNAASPFTLSIAGPANSGIDYLSVSNCTVATDSPGEFYVGANSTNVSGNTRVIFTATPAARTLYWVGGTGNWSSTTKWSTSSGGASGAAIPTSLDAVVFDSASNATAYTATIDAGVTLARCASFTMAGPLSGNVTFAGAVAIAFHGNVSFAATGITRTYTGNMYWAGNSSYTFTTNGLTLNSTTIFVAGIGASWVLGSPLNNSSSQLTITYGVFDTSSSSSYAVTAGTLFSSNSNVRTIKLNNSLITLSSGQPSITFGVISNFTFNAGTSTITMSSGSPGITSGGLTFYDVNFTSAAAGTIPITGANTFNTLSFAGRTTVGIAAVTFSANQTITTLTLNAGTAAAYRTFLASDTIGTQRTLTVTTLTAGAADYDFRDIAIAGGAAPISGTRFGDAKGNSGITFPAAKTVYYRNTGSTSWGTTGTGSWSATSGGAFDATQFPLAQDTAVFPAATYPASGSTTTVNANYNIGTIDMSLRTANTMTLATGTQAPSIYGNWINGTGTTLTGTGTMTFAGRGSQAITSAGITFTQPFVINTPGGSVTLTDALTNSRTASAIQLTAGTFSDGGYNITLTDTASGFNCLSVTSTRSVSINGTLTIAGTNGWITSTTTGLSVTGTGTISLTSASAKTFAGGGLAYTNITLNQGGAGALTITGNNTFKDITNTYSATGATNITIGTTTQTVSQWTATGASGKVLTVQGTSASSPGTLILSGATDPNVDYLTVTGVRAYSLTDTWYAGNNSTNSGSLGWIFTSGSTAISAFITETARPTDANTTIATLNLSLSETARLSDTDHSRLVFFGNLSESATVADAVAAVKAYLAAVIEGATSSDVVAAARILYGALQESVRAQDSLAVQSLLNVPLTEAARGSDSIAGRIFAKGTVSESAAVQDAVSRLATLNMQILEALRTADAAAVASSAFGAAFTNTAAATDRTQGANTGSSSLSESAAASETQSAKFTAVANTLEQGAAQDSLSALMVFRTGVSELAAAQDSTSVAPSVFSATAAAAAAVFDNFNPAGSIYNAVLPVEGASAADSLIGAYLWNVINTAQDPNWTNIQTPQNPNWTAIDDSQTPGWQNINTLN